MPHDARVSILMRSTIDVAKVRKRGLVAENKTGLWALAGTHSLRGNTSLTRQFYFTLKAKIEPDRGVNLLGLLEGLTEEGKFFCWRTAAKVVAFYLAQQQVNSQTHAFNL
jgi:hypothetical protein